MSALSDVGCCRLQRDGVAINLNWWDISQETAQNRVPLNHVAYVSDKDIKCGIVRRRIDDINEINDLNEISK